MVNNIEINTNNENSSSVSNRVLIIGKCLPHNIETLDGSFITKVPIILTEFRTQIRLQYSLNFSYEISKIDRINYKLKKIECIPILSDNILHIKGIIQTNITYLNHHPLNIIGALGCVRSCIIDIPFKLNTSFKYELYLSELEENMLSKNKCTSLNSELENEIQEEIILSNNLNSRNSITFTYYNVLPYCEVIRTEIIDEKTETDVFTYNDVTKPLGIVDNIRVNNTLTMIIEGRIVQERYVRIK